MKMNKENANPGEPMKDNIRKRRSRESDDMVIEEERSETKKREVNDNTVGKKCHFPLENFPKNREIRYVKNTITTQELTWKTPKPEKNHGHCLKTTRE